MKVSEERKNQTSFASGEAELRAFLGDKYDSGKDESELIRQWSAAPRRSREEVEEFYRSADAYLYDLTRWHASYRFPYADVVCDFAWRFGFKHLLEFGCGIGTDGLKLIQRGFDVSFYDFRNPSTEYLKWRLEQRSLKSRIYYAGEDDLPDNDLTFAIDVIEHVLDPAKVLAEIARRTKAVVCHLPLTLQQYKYPMHFDLNRRALRGVLRKAGFERVWDFSLIRYRWGLLLFWEAPEFWLKE